MIVQQCTTRSDDNQIINSGKISTVATSTQTGAPADWLLAFGTSEFPKCKKEPNVAISIVFDSSGKIKQGELSKKLVLKLFIQSVIAQFTTKSNLKISLVNVGDSRKNEVQVVAPMRNGAKFNPNNFFKNIQWYVHDQNPAYNFISATSLNL